MHESRRRFVAALAAAVTGALAGCGGGESTTPGESGTGTPTETDTPTEADTATQADTPTQTPTATSAVAQVVQVGADGFQFAPERVEIAAGDAVEWTWASGGHNVQPDAVPDGSDWTGTAGSATDTYASGHTYRHTFDVPGRYDYYCAPHQGAGMTGSVTVTQR